MASATIMQQALGSRPARTAAHRAPRGQVQCSAAPQYVARSPEEPAPRQLIGQSRRTLLLGGLAVAAGTMGCSCCPPLARASDWNYTCPGPDGWEGACSAGLAQSPIDIPLPSPLDQIKFNYPSQVMGTVINNGHGSPQVNMPNDEAKITMKGETYSLVQLHFHAPSEHTFNGKHALMEAHLVHKNDKSGELAVLGVMLDAGAAAPLPVLDTVLGSAPNKTGVTVPLEKPISLLSILPPLNENGRRAYARYDGSLTTPPCTEGVLWTVFLEPVKVQATQVLAFMGYASDGASVSFNSRPVQPLGDRQLRFYS